MIKKSSFTIAEILITLGIIGIVAAMTIPTLIYKTNENTYKVSYRKAYAEISQALIKANQSDDLVGLTGTYGSYGGAANFEALKKQFAISLDCNNNNLSDCWDTNGEKWRSEGTSSSIPAFVDKAGFVWKLRQIDGSLAPGVQVDINGKKGPNQYGKDRFPFAYKNYIGVWSTIQGIPTSMASYPYDVTDTSDTFSCPSVKSHPCYYRSWLLGK